MSWDGGGIMNDYFIIKNTFNALTFYTLQIPPKKQQ